MTTRHLAGFLMALIVIAGCGPSGKKPSAESDPALLEACKSGDVPRVSDLIEEGVDVNAKYAHPSGSDHPASGFSVLHAAAANGHYEVVEVLLKAGADPNARRDDGETPLFRAIGAPYHSDKVFRLLIDAKAKVAAKDDGGRTALHIAAASGKPQLVELLIDAGANVNAVDDDAETPLHEAVRSFDRRNQFRQNMQTAVARRLVQADADMDAKNSAGKTPLELSHLAPMEVRELLGEKRRQPETP